MKVKIGRYVNWIGPYQIGTWFSKIGFSEETCDKIGDFLASTWIDKFCNWIYNKKSRKIIVHIHDYDIWGMDSTLAYIILPMLIKLKEYKNGSPHVDDEDVPENIRSTYSLIPKKNEWDTDEYFHDRWEYVLEEIIWAFSQINEDWEDQYYNDYGEWKFVDLENGNSEIKTIKEPVFDKEGLANHQKRMTNGFRLFGKYYQGLWT